LQIYFFLLIIQLIYEKSNTIFMLTFFCSSIFFSFV